MWPIAVTRRRRLSSLGAREVVVEVGEEDRASRRAAAPGSASPCALHVEVDGRRVVLDERVVRRVLEVRAVPRALATAAARRGSTFGHAAVAVLGDAHRRVEPAASCRTSPRRSSVAASVTLRSMRDPGLAHVLLDELGEVGHLEPVPRAQLNAEAVLLARRGEQLLGLAHVLLALRRPRRSTGRPGANGLSLPRSAFVSSRPSTSALAVDEQRHRLAHALVLERLVALSQVDLAVRRGLQLDRADVGVGQQRLAARDGELDEDVDLVALEPEHERLLVGVEADLGPVGDRDPVLVPVLRVAARS